jgi:hypothetical protein
MHPSRHALLGTLLGSVVALAGACAPQNASIGEGSFVGFLSVNTSAVFVNDDLRIEDFDENWVIDCRALPEGQERLEGAIDNCAEGGGVRVPRQQGAEVVLHEAWIDRDAYVVVREELDPWRGEAVMTSEGDLQLTFHHRLPGGDFRWSTVIDPNFQPVECLPQDDGQLAFTAIDGDWVQQWSAAMTTPNYEGGDVVWPGRSDEGFVIPLNAVSYQFNPGQTEQTWSLPPTMEAGYARARFGPEEIFNQSSRYGLPSAYLAFDLDDREGPPRDRIWYAELPVGATEDELRDNRAFQNLMRTAEATAFQTQEELAAFGVPNPERFRPFIPSNAWRSPDGTTGGFDGWAEMHYSWIRIDQPREDVRVGADISGEFVAWFFGSNSQSRFMVEGTFEVSNVKKDRWTVPNVQQERLEESNTNLCGRQFGETED